MRNAFGCLFLLVLLAAAVLFARDYIRRHPQDVPWTELDLDQPIGRFTGQKLAGLGDEPRRCTALLQETGSESSPVPPRQAGPNCGYSDGIRLTGTAEEVRYAPAGPVTSCPVAAAMLLLERQVIAPAAQEHLGTQVTAIVHAGSYSCRRLYGRAEGPFSEHATANAFDITGFRLADGSQVSVLSDWNDEGPRGDFLREVRDGACSLFATVLSPDYNAAHADHLHLDQAARGRTGWGLCS